MPVSGMIWMGGISEYFFGVTLRYAGVLVGSRRSGIW